MRKSEFRKYVPTPPEIAVPATEIYVRLSELRQHGIPWGKRYVYRMIAAGLFPAPVMLGPNTRAWGLYSQLAPWKAARPVAPVKRPPVEPTTGKRKVGRPKLEEVPK